MLPDNKYLGGTVYTVAGIGEAGYSGDGGPAIKAQVNDVYGLGIDQYDNIYSMDSLNFVVRRTDAKTKIIRTIVGKGMAGPISEFERVSDCYIGRVVHE